MTSVEILALVVTAIGVSSFAAIFTILYMSFAKTTISEVNSGKRDIELLDEVIYQQQTKVKKRKEITGTIKSVIFFTFIGVVTPLFIFSIVNKLQGNVTMLGDRSLMIVASGSMSYKHESNLHFLEKYDNQFQQYDIIVLEKVDSFYDLKVGDVIAFKVDDKKVGNVIHRIKSVDYVSKGFITQGDAVESPDGYNPKYDQVVGRYITKRIPLIGIFVIFFQSGPGIVTVLALLYCLLMIDSITKKIDKAQNKRVEKLAVALDFTSEKNAKGFDAKYSETIYYKGFAYHFNEDGFISKEEVEEGPYLEVSDDSMIKVVEDEQTKEVISETVYSTKDEVETTSNNKKEEVETTSENQTEKEKGEDNA